MGAADTCSTVIGFVTDTVRRCGRKPHRRTPVTLTSGTVRGQLSTVGIQSFSFVAEELFTCFPASNCCYMLIPFEGSPKTHERTTNAVCTFQHISIWAFGLQPSFSRLTGKQPVITSITMFQTNKQYCTSETKQELVDFILDSGGNFCIGS